MSTPINIGDTSMREVPGARFIYKRGEAAQLIRPFEGDASTLAAWLNTQALGVTTDYEVPDFVLDQVEGVENGAIAEAKQTFYADPLGLPFYPSNPNSPSVVSRLAWEPRSANIRTTNAADGIFTVNYLAPIVSYRYCTSVLFNTPNFYSASNASFPQNTSLFDFAPVAGSGPGGTTLPYGYAPLGTWVYKLYPICTTFTRDQKASVYNYVEGYSVIIQDPNGASPVQVPSGAPSIPPVQ